jgi:hypothetical protein
MHFVRANCKLNLDHFFFRAFQRHVVKLCDLLSAEDFLFYNDENMIDLLYGSLKCKNNMLRQGPASASCCCSVPISIRWLTVPQLTAFTKFPLKYSFRITEINFRLLLGAFYTGNDVIIRFST